MISCSWLVGSATSFRKDTPALKSELTMTPASTTTRMRLPFARPLMMSTKKTVSSEKQKAVTESMRELKPRMMASAAPNAAPWEAPKMSGLTSGFWNVPW